MMMLDTRQTIQILNQSIPRSGGLARAIVLLVPAPAGDEEAARLAEELRRVADEGRIARAGENAVSSRVDERESAELGRPITLPVVPAPESGWPTCDAVAEWLRREAPAVSDNEAPWETSPSLLMLPLVPGGRVWDLKMSEMLGLCQGLAAYGFAVSCLPIVAAARQCAAGEFRMLAEKKADGVAIDGIIIVPAIHGGAAATLEALAWEAHLAAWQLAQLATAQRRDALRQLGGVALGRARRLAHPAPIMLDIAAFDLAADALRVALERDGPRDPFALDDGQDAAWMELESVGAQLVDAAVDATSGEQLRMLLADRIAEIERGTAILLSAHMAPRERAAALDGLHARLVAIEQGTGNAASSTGLAACIRDAVEEPVAALREALQIEVCAALERGPGQWDAAETIVRGAEVAASRLYGSAPRAAARPQPSLAWPAQPGESFLRLDSDRTPTPALITLSLLLFAGIYWPTSAVAARLALPGSMVWLAAGMAASLPWLIKLADHATISARRRRYAASLRTAMEQWTRDLVQWGAETVAPECAREAIASSRRDLQQAHETWQQAHQTMRQRGAQKRQSWIVRSTSAIVPLLRPDELERGVARVVGEADPAACAWAAARNLAADAQRRGAGRAGTILGQPQDAIIEQHLATARATLAPLSAEVRHALDAYLERHGTRLTTALAAQARSLGSASAPHEEILFLPGSSEAAPLHASNRSQAICADETECSVLLLASAQPVRADETGSESADTIEGDVVCGR